MVHFKCYPTSNPDYVWPYCPSFGAAIAFCMFFGIVTFAHITQGIIYRRAFTIVVIMGATWETAGYAFRAVSITKQLNSTIFTVQLLLILLAPLWINAFVYMVLGRMIHFYLQPDKAIGIRARNITKMFVWFDVFSFLVQLIGGLMTNSSNPLKTQRLGIHIYMGGVGLQLAFCLIFVLLAASFHRSVKRANRSTPAPLLLPRYGHSPSDDDLPTTGAADMGKATPSFDFSNGSSPTAALRLLYTVYAVLSLIVFRNIYRLIEFSLGVLSSITTHEWYAYVFDAVPMLIALVIFNFLHPCRTIRGPRSDFSEENKAIKEAKRAKKLAKKEGKKAAKKERLVTKNEEKERRKQRAAGRIGRGTHQELRDEYGV
ncbi:hypothetical protein DV736_g3129, partial [Chaetothyriales sp. CBS 134916]